MHSNSKSTHSTFGLIFSFCFFLISCTVQKPVVRTTYESVINDPALAAAHVGISVYDPEAGKYLYDYQGHKFFVPASNTKIPTAYAAMKILGDSIVALRYVDAGKKIAILPSADPTFLHSDFKKQPAYQFLLSYDSIIILKPLFEDDFLGSGWSWNDYKASYMAQRSNLPIYGNTVSFRWIDDKTIKATPAIFSNNIVVAEDLKEGFEVGKSWEENNFIFMKGGSKSTEVPFRPNPATILELLRDTLKKDVRYDFLSSNFNTKKVHSQPTDSLLKPMMHRSDNFYAEQSLLMASNELLGVMSDEKIIDTILKTYFNDLPQKPRWVDGSGLSRYNLFTPQSFVAILNKMKNEFGMERIKEIFPTGGEGTLSSYYKADSGFIYAKTGTLSGVVALSGYLYTKTNKLLLFSVLVNNHHSSATDVRRAVESFLQKVRNEN